MTFCFRVDLAGKVDVAQLSAAFSEVVGRHPILWSTVVRRFGRLYWKMVPERMPTLAVRRTVPFSQFKLKTHIDLADEPGIRAQLNLTGKMAELWLQFHHSCNDGIGGVGFLNELFDAYRLRLSGDGAAVTGRQPEFPSRRCAYQNLSGRAKTNRLFLDATRIWNFLWRPLVDFRDGHLNGSPTQPSATLSFMEARLPFKRSLITRLKQAAAPVPTVNDVLLRDVYLALGDWLQQQPSTDQDGWIRISAATNMRHPTATGTRCHNDVSLVFLDRRSGDLRDQSQLLSGISTEMSQIKKDQMGCAMLRGLNWTRALPGGIALGKRLRRAYATAIVSNLGNVRLPHSSVGNRPVGDLTVATLGFLVPIRNGTPVSFGVLTHADELTIGMQYDDGVMAYESAQRLLHYVTTRLCDSLGIDARQVTGQRARRAA